MKILLWKGGTTNEIGDIEVTAGRGRTVLRTVQGSVREKRAGMGKQTVRQAARLAASSVQAQRRRERAERDRRLEKLAVDVRTAIGERDATIAATEKRAGMALQAMIEAERMSVTEAVQWCAGKITTREATRLRRQAVPIGDAAARTAEGGTGTGGSG